MNGEMNDNDKDPLSSFFPHLQKIIQTPMTSYLPEMKVKAKGFV